MPERLLNPREAAQLLGVKPSTLERWRSASRSNGPPRGPAFVKLGGKRIRYRPEDIVAYIEERRIEPGRNA